MHIHIGMRVSRANTLPLMLIVLAGCGGQRAAEAPAKPEPEAPSAVAPTPPPAPSTTAQASAGPAALAPAQAARAPATPAPAVPHPRAEMPRPARATASGAASALPPAEMKADTPATLATSAACGEKGQPKCPLQAWMEQQLQDSLDAGDLKRVGAAFEKLARFAPDASWNAGATGWSAIASGAAVAAAGGDAASVKQACKTCHKTWRNKYKASFRQRPIAD